MDKKTVAIFDFCETIVNFQTADPFVDFTSKKNIRNKLIDIFCYFVARTPFVNKMHKRLKLLKLFGLTKEYFEKILRYSEIKVIIDRINYHKKRGDLIIIASGGYNSYLEVFGSAMDISIIVSTEILFRNNICMGLINGPDCLNENKKTKLLKVINWHSIDEANSFFYSDSLSDLPMFKIVKNGFLVSFSNNEYKLIELVYGEN